MTPKRTPQWHGVHQRATSALKTALDPEESRGQHVQRSLDVASARGEMNAALADASEEWNNAHPDALLRLPTELAHAVWRLLAFRDRIAVSHVSRGWRTAALGDAFLWNAFTVKRPWNNPLVWYPPPGRAKMKPPPSPPPPPRKADVLRELLARSDPAPFALAWRNQWPPYLPDEIIDMVLQNIHRMQELAVDLSARDFERLFALPAPALRSVVCTTDSETCELPMDALETWTRCLPALRELTVEYARKARVSWPPLSALAPLRVPMLEDVRLILDADARWATQQFPELLRSRFAYTRPLLASIVIKADSKAAPGFEPEDSLAGLRALAECVQVTLVERAASQRVRD
ncbi:hypothetical protein AURDEDRAFT_168144 [Auricularia subglabra TFB-10046 SS5]|nr:hypothetical protein AURDEDRAFT_168144 [Auricularia subglabra TFB-10046 SS5]